MSAGCAPAGAGGSDAERAPDRAAAAIRSLVIDGSYSSGDRLPAERDLARALQVSRGALREGIKRLVEGGLLESRRSSGVYVVQVDLGDVFTLRQALEPLAARLAAENRSEEEASNLMRLSRELGRALPDPAPFSALDAEVHAAVASAAGNPLLSASLTRLSDLAAVSRGSTVPSLGARDATRRDIGWLAEAVRNRDTKGAADAMSHHLEAMRAVWEAASGGHASSPDTAPLAS